MNSRPVSVLRGSLHKFRTAVLYHPLLWVCIAFFMLGMNYLPNHWINPFPIHTSLGFKVHKKKLVRRETFNTAIASKFTSVDNLYLYLLTHSKDTSNKYELLTKASDLLRHRFFHAYSVYSLNENWIAVLAGRFIWRDLSAKVLPDDILKGNVAACSQVSIVFMKLCEKFNIPTRKVALKGHYTTEAYCNDRWYFFDLDVKPDFQAINGRKSLNAILKQGELFRLYQNTILDSSDVASVFSTIKYGVPNAHPAPRAAVFHEVTKVISHWGWILPLLISFVLLFKRVSVKQKSPSLTGCFFGSI